MVPEGDIELIGDAVHPWGFAPLHHPQRVPEFAVRDGAIPRLALLCCFRGQMAVDVAQHLLLCRGVRLGWRKEAVWFVSVEEVRGDFGAPAC